MPFQKVQPEKISTSVVRQIELLILRGILRPGERLPSERELSERLGVSRPSLREALGALQEKGLLEARAGAGVFVAEGLRSVFPPALVRLASPAEQDSSGLLSLIVFVLSLVILGYLISTVSRTQMQAMQLTFFFFLPSIMLSGFMFPFRGMPLWAQYLGEIFPLTHFLRLVRGVMLKGADLADVAAPLAALGIFTALLTLVTLARFRRTLD